MPLGLGASLGIGGGRSSTSSGAPAGGATPFANDWSCDFDGTEDVLEVGNIGTAGRSLGAVSFWAKPDTAFATNDVSSRGYLLGFGGAWGGINYGFMAATTRMLTYYKAGNMTIWEAGTGQSLSDDWHNIVMTHNGTGYTFYVDGQLASNIVGTITVTTMAIVTGADFDNFAFARMGSGLISSYLYPGLLDEIAIWDAALSAGDIEDIYNGGTPTDLTSLSPSGWWRMGDTGSDSGTGAGQAVSTITNAIDGGSDATQSTGSAQPNISSTVPS